MRKLVLSTAPVLLTLFWANTPPALAQPTLVAASSDSARYIYRFSGNIQFQFGATDLVTPGTYAYTGLPFPPNGGTTGEGFRFLTLTSTGEWRLSRWLS